MSRVFLRLERNAQTGLPRLTIEGLALSRADHATLERELHQRFGELVAKGEGELFEIRTPLKQFPRPSQFRIVELSQAQSRRCPDLVLESVQVAPEESEQEQGFLLWDKFRAAARELLGRVPTCRQSPLRQMLEEFCRLEGEPAQEQFLTIFAGYLLLQRVLCDQDRRMRRALLDEAIEAMARAFPVETPKGPAVPQPARSPAASLRPVTYSPQVYRPVRPPEDRQAGPPR